MRGWAAVPARDVVALPDDADPVRPPPPITCVYQELSLVRELTVA